MQPNQFKDLSGRVWTLVLTVDVYLKLNQKYGVDVNDIFDNQDNWLTKLLAQDDMITFLQILHDLCEKERVSKDISADDFFESLCGDTLGPASEALVASVVNFLPSHRRVAVKSIMEAMKKGLMKSSEKASQLQPEIDAWLDKNVDKEFDNLKKRIQELT